VAEPDEQVATNGGRLATLFGVFVILGTLAAGALVLYRIYPAHVQEKASPGFVDNIFGSNLVVFAARLTLLSAALVLAFAGGYIVLSIISWIKHRQWLTKMGPFEVSREAIEQLQGMVELWREHATEQANEIERLQGQLQETNDLFDLFLKDQPEEGFEGEGESDNLGDDDDRDTPQAGRDAD
jgi:hypothetical protein